MSDHLDMFSLIALMTAFGALGLLALTLRGRQPP